MDFFPKDNVSVDDRYMKVFPIIKHQVNTDQTHKEESPYICEEGRKRNICVAEEVEKRESLHLLVWTDFNTAIMESSMEVT